MKQTSPLKICTLLAFVVVLYACHTQRNLYRLYTMKDFNINYANEFVRKMHYLQPVDQISIVDTKADGNDFRVNGQTIFLDTSQQDQPNYYCYRKRAGEINVSGDSLADCLKTFYKVGVNEFNRDSNYYRLRVAVGLTADRGYIYANNNGFQPGDTLPATSPRNRQYHFKVLVVRKVAENWFEYLEAR